jgi:hypothetical protein
MIPQTSTFYTSKPVHVHNVWRASQGKYMPTIRHHLVILFCFMYFFALVDIGFLVLMFWIPQGFIALILVCFTILIISLMDAMFRDALFSELELFAKETNLHDIPRAYEQCPDDGLWWHIIGGMPFNLNMEYTRPAPHVQWYFPAIYFFTYRVNIAYRMLIFITNAFYAILLMFGYMFPTVADNIVFIAIFALVILLGTTLVVIISGFFLLRSDSIMYTYDPMVYTSQKIL